MLLSNIGGAAPTHDAAEGQDDERSNEAADQTGGMNTRGLVVADQASEKASQKWPQRPQKRGHDDAHILTARHQGARQEADYQTENQKK